MFGSSGSPPKSDAAAASSSPTEAKTPSIPVLAPADGSADAPTSTATTASPERRSEDSSSPVGDKRTRRSSGMAKAKDMFSSAKHSFSASPTRGGDSKSVAQTPIQKLGKTDPALSVPQGSQNNAAGESNPGPRSTFRVGVTEDKNKKCRRTMEDTHAYLYNFLSTPLPSTASENQLTPSSTSNGSVEGQLPIVESDNGYFAIFDGHAGTFAAEWCGKKLHILLEEAIRKYPNRPIPELLDETFTNVDQQLEKLPLKNSGCTAVIAVLRWEDRVPSKESATGTSSVAQEVGKQLKESDAVNTTAEAIKNDVTKLGVRRDRVLYTANVGDARIVLCRNGKALRLSYDHKGSDDNEGKRIANAGGLILNNRVNGVLAVTRALGDAYMKDLVTGHPYTTETVIQPEFDEFIILACDGLWDVCSDQEAVDLIRNVQDPVLASKMLVDHALSRFSTDNLSCMVVRLDKSGLFDTIEKRVEPIGVEGDRPTQLRGGVTEAEAILDAAKKDMPVVDPHASEDLSKISSEIIREEEEQEPGPELDPDGLAKVKEKAAEGKAAVGES
ncbi:hypothetical protein FH972_026253 [Carpinus fangiana]|uniref:protein-serine/threonine phosphatase n=1 Tax=Carpinus fangiana TaxID=176857 RepID=A0A5N6L3G0_9ROSI|nr:hypothetical protein FH972_026253 [Carpinus fangiana]